MKTLSKILTIVLLSSSLFACNDKLDNVNPSRSVAPEAALSTQTGISAIRTSMLDRLHGFYYTTLYFLAPSALADGLVNRANANRLNAQVLNLGIAGAHVNSWDGIGMPPLNNGNAYDLINDANLLINSITPGVISVADSAKFVGEAYFMRAFAYHHLVRDYGYEPGMTPQTGPGQGFTEGVPIRLKPTLDAPQANKFRPRAPVSKVYDQIRSDLKNAISLLGQSQNGKTIYPSVAAAQALMARVQLYARNYSSADEFATKALANTSAQLVSGDAVADEFDESKGLNPEAIFIITTNPSTESLGINNSLPIYTSQSFAFSLIPTQDLLDLYQPNDARLPGWFAPCFDENNQLVPPGCIATNPGIDDNGQGLELHKWTTETNNQQAVDYPFIRVPEMLLIQSEARLHTGGDALGPINTLRTSRNLDPLSSVDIQEILNERRREFAGEGQRYWDLKRLGRTIQKAPETKTAQIRDVSYTNFRILDEVPTDEVALSQARAPADSQLVQNPGY